MLKYRNPASVQMHAKLKLCFVRGDATPATLVRQLVLRDQGFLMELVVCANLYTWAFA